MIASLSYDNNKIEMCKHCFHWSETNSKKSIEEIDKNRIICNIESIDDYINKTKDNHDVKKCWMNNDQKICVLCNYLQKKSVVSNDDINKKIIYKNCILEKSFEIFQKEVFHILLLI